MDWIPIVSQTKSLVQFLGGNTEGANQTQVNFSKTCPIVSQGMSLVQSISGDNVAALETQKAFGKAMSGAADAIPIVGHVKGAIHYACGDNEGYVQAMKNANQNIGVFVWGVVCWPVALGLIAAKIMREKNDNLEHELTALNTSRLESLQIRLNDMVDERNNGTVSNRVSEPNEHRLSEDVERVVQYHLKNSICDNSDDWKLIYTDKNNVQIYRRELIENGVVCDPIKAVFTIKGITGHELCQNFWNSSSSHEYGVIKKREVFFDLKSNDTFIVHEHLNKHWAAAQRDICFWSHIRNFDSNGISSWIAVNYSTEHEQAPIISPVIRAKINIALIGRTKLENNATKSSCSREDLTCEVTYVAFINPGGYVPVVILRKLFEKEYANFVSSFSNFVKEQTAGKDILF